MLAPPGATRGVTLGQVECCAIGGTTDVDAWLALGWEDVAATLDGAGTEDVPGAAGLVGVAGVETAAAVDGADRLTTGSSALPAVDEEQPAINPTAATA